MPDKPPDSLAAALAAFQADLPNVHKNSKVDTGRYVAKYADLATISAAVLPKLGALGLSWITRPTTSDSGFVLAYTLLHSSGERLDGEYPLPDPTKVTPQQIGSAVTYAKRYCLCSVVGVAPDEDDDGVAASDTKAAPRKAERIKRPAAPVQDEWTEPVTDEAWKAGWVAHVSTATSREQLNELWKDLGRARRERQCSTPDADDLAAAWKERTKELPETGDAWPTVAPVPA